MGDAYAKTFDSNGIVRYLKFSNSTLQKELPANLICVDKLLFDEKGNERDMDVDFKKLKLHMSQHSSEPMTLTLCASKSCLCCKFNLSLKMT